MTRRVALVLGCGLAVFAALQVTGPSRTNPPTDRALRLEAQAQVPPVVAGVLRRACYDCHSHETRWPWYSNVAPVSWLVIRDVTRGRGQMNFSRWGEYNPFDRADLLDNACRRAANREMPLWTYRLMHPAARLADDEVASLCGWTRTEAGRLAGE